MSTPIVVVPGSSGISDRKANVKKSIHTTPQLRCSEDISITFCRKSPQHHRISN